MSSIPLFLTCGIKFLGNLSLDISPPSDSLAALAGADYDAAFPAQSRGEKDAYLLLLAASVGATILAERLATERRRSSTVVPEFARGVQAFVRDFAAAHGGDASWAECTDGLLSFFECLHERNFSLLEATTLNTRNLSAATATLLRIQPPDDAVHTFGAALAAHVAGAPSELLVQTAGLPSFLAAAQDSVSTDLRFMDMVSLPLALRPRADAPQHPPPPHPRALDRARRRHLLSS